MASPITLVSFLLLWPSAHAQPAPLAITHVTVVDATGAAPQHDMMVVIGGEPTRATSSSAAASSAWRSPTKC